jgi:endonuclease YncB( thermonuclease family)
VVNLLYYFAILFIAGRREQMERCDVFSPKTYAADIQPNLSPSSTFRCLPAILLILSIFISPSFAKDPIRTVDGVVIKVVDGDTITVKSDGTKLKVRMYGVDAPETEITNRRTGRVNKSGQPYGEEAYRALYYNDSRKTVRLDIMDVDRYRRMVAIVWPATYTSIEKWFRKDGHGYTGIFLTGLMRRST